MIKKCLSAKELRTCGRQSGFQTGKKGELILNDRQYVGIFISCMYDSGVPGTEWNRLVLDVSPNAILQAYIYLFDDAEEGKKIEEKETVGEQFDYLEKHAQYASNYRETILYGQERGRGRFAKIGLKFLAEAGTGRISYASNRKVQFFAYELSFPKESFTRYLPSIYRGNLALERFLAVHQSLYLDLERQIDDLAVSLDFDTDTKEESGILADWMGWGTLARMGEEEILRSLLRTGTSLISQKGSCGYYVEMLRLLTGCEPVVIEEPEKKKCTLLIQDPAEDKEKYLKWLQKNTPIGIKIEILILRKTECLDKKYFLDFTSMLSEEESALLDGGTEIGKLRLL